MCGIAGLVDFQRAPEESVLRAMERSIEHRGPDSGGLWRSGPVGLVHRRLRIIDLSPLGAQPMANEDGRVQIVFNGEIYNHRALRAELEALGHVFRSRSDTEVLVHGYESWGTALAGRLRGMFALAIWDDREQRLYLARDRVGKKPFYVSEQPGRLAFGSELEVFKAIPGWPLRLSLPAFREYLAYGYVPAGHSLLEDVRQLGPGQWAIYDRSGWRSECYWSVPRRPVPPADPGWAGVDPARAVAAAADALEPILRDAVACRLESDVPLGCFLSGGIDSSLIAMLAQESLGQPLKTYTVGFEGSVQSEAEHARKVATRLGAEHHELPVHPRTMLEEFAKILQSAPEPVGDDSYVPTYLISRETRRYVTVAMSGDGGDELFAGYEKYRQYLAARRWRRWPLPWGLLARFAPRDGFFKKASALASPSDLELARWLSSLWKRGEPEGLLLPSVLSQAVAGAAGRDAFGSGWEARGAFSDVERWMLTDMETYLEADILTKVDRASMAVALEARSPFLDARLIDEVWRWPIRAVQPGGGKAILKAMLAKRLPLEWFERPKQGFGLPIEHWYRGELRGVLEACTAPGRVRSRGLLRPEAVTAAVQAHLSGRRNFARKLHVLVAFELWADRFFGPGRALA